MTIDIKKRAIIVSLTFPPALIEKIDQKRGDVSRSGYIRRMIQKGMEK